MYTLYCAAGVCSMAVHVVMKELGVEHKQEAYLKINPRGQVASLKTPEGVITQNVAMIDYLNAKHDGDVLGAEGLERARAMEWLLFANADLHGAYSKALFAIRGGADDAFVKNACDNVQAQWDQIEQHLAGAGTQYLAGDRVTAGDIYTAVVANWQFIPYLPTFGPKTQVLIDAVSSGDSFQRALEAENVSYKAAA